MEDFLNIEQVEELLASSKDKAQMQLYICIGAAIVTCIVLFFLLKYSRKKIGKLGKKHHEKIMEKITEVKEEHENRKNKNKDENDEEIQDRK